MAVDEWIIMRKILPEEPAVLAIATLLKLDIDTVIGKLFRVWAWADSRTTSGRLKDCTFEMIDTVARCESFSNAMESARWLSRNEDGSVTLPRWTKHHPKSAKKRSLDAARQARKRSRDKRDTVTQPSRSERDCHAATKQNKTVQNKDNLEEGFLVAVAGLDWSGSGRDVLTRLGIREPSLSALADHPDCTALLVCEQWQLCSTATNPRGALVGRLSKKLGVAVPKSTKSIGPALSAETSRLIELRNAKRGVA